MFIDSYRKGQLGNLFFEIEVIAFRQTDDLFFSFFFVTLFLHYFAHLC